MLDDRVRAGERQGGVTVIESHQLRGSPARSADGREHVQADPRPNLADTAPNWYLQTISDLHRPGPA